MLKAVFAATAAITIAGTSIAYAQQRDGRPDDSRRSQPTIEDMRAFQAARLAAVRAGLMLTSEQERHWPAFEQAMREIQQQRLSRITKMREARRQDQPSVAADPAERMRQRAARLSESGAVLKRLADATDPLYRSLDEGQKRRFAILTRAGGPRGVWQRRGGRDGGEQGTPRQRRTDATPGLQQGERTFSRKAIDANVVVEVPQVFGSKLVMFEVPAVFARKAIAPESVQFGGKVSAFGAKFTSPEGVTFRRKVTIEEPAGFGSKLVREI